LWDPKKANPREYAKMIGILGYHLIYPLVICYIAMVCMAHRNRWFTWVYLLKMGGSSMAMLNNQRVYPGYPK